MPADYEISVLLPTRGRARQCEEMLCTLAETSAEPDRIEIVLRVDRDDSESHDIDAAGMAVTRLIRPRAMMGVMTNECYRASRGRYIFLANDDVVFHTQAWDLRFREALAEFRDDIGFVWGNDGYTGGPTHPILTRTVCELMGGVCPNAYDRVFIDVHLHDLFQKLKQRGHDRLRFLPDVQIEHLHVDAGKSTGDATSAKSHLHDDEMIYIHYEDERCNLASDLAGFIEAHKQELIVPDTNEAASRLARAA